MRGLLDEPSLLRDALWQSTLCLALALLAARLVRRRPARAHAALALGLVAATCAPLASALARAAGWGLFAAPAPIASGGAAPGLEGIPVLAGAALGARDVLLGLWAAVAATGLVRLALGFRRSAAWARSAAPVDDPELRALAQATARRLGVGPVELAASGRIASPVAWCWSRPPRVVLPARAALRREALAGVLAHELAHVARRDHWTALAGEVAARLLFWHPLAHRARRELALASERACDAWALTSGADPADYAEALLALAPRRAPALALGAVTGRGSLRARLAAILREPPAEPRAGRAWVLAATVGAGLALPALALAQSAPADPPPPSEAREEPALAATAAESAGLDVVPTPVELDLGEAPAGGSAAGSVWLVNRGARPRRIVKVQPTCGCVALAEVDGTVLEPGASLEIPLSMTAPKELGERKTQKLRVAVEGQPLLEVAIHLRAGAPPG